MEETKEYTRIVLKNGVRLLIIPISGVKSVATSVMVGVGSRHETPQVNGISHFLEHLVFKGTKKYPTSDDVNIVERIGGLQNAYTDVDATNFHNKVISTDWEQALEINKELALSPLLEKKHIDRERGVILEEMKRYDDEPASKVEEVFHAMLYRGTKLGMRTIGEVESLQSITQENLMQYHAQWYRPDRMVVVVAGGIGEGNKRQATSNKQLPSTKHQATNTKQIQQQIKERVEEWFGDLQGAGEGGIDHVDDTQKKPNVEVLIKPEVQQAHMVLGLRTFPRAHKNRFAWSVFNLAMGVSFTSRLFRQIREKKGLCYHIRSGSSAWQDVGCWSIYAGVATEKVEQATKAILEELAKARERGITEEEVAVSKKRIQTMVAFRSEDPEFHAEFYGRQDLFGEPVMTIGEYLSRIDGVSAEDINVLLRKYIVPQTLNLAVVSSQADENQLTKLLVL